MTRNRVLTAILIGGLILRAALWIGVDFPGIADPNHYYNLGVRLVEGHGFTIDYIWQYSGNPSAIEHPEEHWMPLAAILAAAPMSIFGVQPRIALIPFVLLGSLLPLIAYLGARRIGAGTDGALFTAAACAVLPELVLNSLRTDTTLPFALFASGALLCMMRRTARFAVLAGILTGLAYLTRNDGLLLVPTALIAYFFFNAENAEMQRKTEKEGKRKSTTAPRILLFFALLRLRVFALILCFFLAALIVVSPWLIRNWTEFGALGSPETRIMWFFTHHDDHYAYQRDFNLQTLLAAQTPAQIIGKRVFEMAAAVVMMIHSFGDALAVAVIGGIALWWQDSRLRKRTGQAWIGLSLQVVFIFIIGAFVAYTLLLPYKAQAGSYKKAFLSVVPLLLPFAGLALERAISDTRLRRGAMALIVLILALNAIQTVRTDSAAAQSYLSEVEAAADVARTLPDTNGDGVIILMTQDPYIVRYVGFSSIMYPYEDRDTIAAAAARYGVDYLLMPPNRPSLNAIYNGTETDARFIRAVDVPGTPFAFYRFAP